MRARCTQQSFELNARDHIGIDTVTELWPAMGRAGRRHVEQNYNCETLSRQTVALYEEAISSRAR